MNRKQRRAAQRMSGQKVSGQPNPRAIFDRAATFLGQGLFADAESLFAELARADPRHADAMNMAGVAASQAGRPEVALEWLRRAIALSPRTADYHANLALVLRQVGRMDEAMAANRAAIELNPQHINALANLSQLQLDLRDAAGAAESARRALSLQRDHFSALTNLGLALCRLAGLGSIRDREDFPNRLNELSEAEQLFRRAVALRPDFADGYSNLAVALHQLDRLDEARECCRRAIRIDPMHSGAHDNLGTTLWEQGLREESIAAHRQAIALNPHFVDARYNLGSALYKCGRAKEACVEFERALAIDPASVQSHWALGFALLTQGRLDPGWRELEWHRQREEKGNKGRRPPHPQPWWAGEDLSDQGILAWGEDGLGDEIQHSAVVPDLAARAGHVVLECEPRLASLYARSFPGVEVVARQNPAAPRLRQGDLRWQTPLAATFQWLRPTLESFPTSGGHLRADPERVAFWRGRLADLGEGLKVGIGWRSKLITKWRMQHYSTLDQWGAVLRVPGVHFVNLQYDECSAELASATGRFGVPIHVWDDLDLMNDMEGASALTTALDLVISPATSVAVMAGALGVPTWMLSPEHLVWQTLGTDHMAFLPSISLVNRPFDASWDTVLDGVGEKLRALVARGSR